MKRKHLKVSLGVFLGCVALTLALPARYDVTRTIIIAAPIGLIFQYVNNLPLNEKWSPWLGVDPTLTYRYGLQKEGEGAYCDWRGKKAGSGRLTVRKSVVPYSIETDLDFAEGRNNKVWWSFAERRQGVLVTWGLSGEVSYNPIARLSALLLNKMLGDTFERGLKDLKQVVEDVSH